MNRFFFTVGTLLVVVLPSSVLAQSDTATLTPLELEPITVGNAQRLEQLEGQLDYDGEGFDISEDSQRIALPTSDGVAIYVTGDFTSPITVIDIPNASRIYNPIFSPDGKMLAVSVIYNESEGATMQLRNIETMTVVKEWFSEVRPFNGVLFSPDGRFLAAQDWAPDTSNDLCVWDIATGETVLHRIARYGTADLAFSPDSNSLIYGIYDFSLENPFSTESFWHIEPLTGEESTLTELSHLARARSGPFSGAVDRVAFSLDGSLLISVEHDSEVTHLWNAQTGMEYAVLPDGYTFLTFNHDNSLLVVNHNDDTLSLLDIETGDEGVLFETYEERAWYASFSADGRLLVTISQDNILHLWGVPVA